MGKPAPVSYCGFGLICSMSIYDYTSTVVKFGGQYLDELNVLDTPNLADGYI